MTLFRIWVVACDFGDCDARLEIGAFMRESEARWVARDHGWTGPWPGPWHCPAHAGEARGLPALRKFHEYWCPADTRDGPCSCRPAVDIADDAMYWARSDMLAWPRRVSNIRLPSVEGEEEDGATGPPVPKPGRAVSGS